MGGDPVRNVELGRGLRGGQPGDADTPDGSHFLDAVPRLPRCGDAGGRLTFGSPLFGHVTIVGPLALALDARGREAHESTAVHFEREADAIVRPEAARPEVLSQSIQSSWCLESEFYGLAVQLGRDATRREVLDHLQR
ncbi:MAG TPA: hypothetical protein VF164_00190 [Trueperaceae bacterium]